MLRCVACAYKNDVEQRKNSNYLLSDQYTDSIAFGRCNQCAQSISVTFRKSSSLSWRSHWECVFFFLQMDYNRLCALQVIFKRKYAGISNAQTIFNDFSSLLILLTFLFLLFLLLLFLVPFHLCWGEKNKIAWKLNCWSWGKLVSALSCFYCIECSILSLHVCVRVLVGIEQLNIEPWLVLAWQKCTPFQVCVFFSLGLPDPFSFWCKGVFSNRTRFHSCSFFFGLANICDRFIYTW